MCFLDCVDEIINENYILEEDYKIRPVEYNPDLNISFEVVDNSNNKIASIGILKIDGDFVNAVDDTYDYKDVYADIVLDDGKYNVDDVKKFILGKLSKMGFDVNNAKIDGKDYDVSKYKDEVSDDVDIDSEIDDIKDEIDDAGDEFSLDDLSDYDEDDEDDEDE